ncbi:zinc finger protein 117-like [Macrobrachium nipponense]|uniref:zinc finger protein 117-like n=1 Tax=Macrobrachium nipponense TaxID=159736 RepID=UPI0030C7FC8B
MEHIGEKGINGLPIARFYYICKCRRVFYDRKAPEQHFLLSKCRNALNKAPLEVTAKKPSKRLVENKRISLTSGNKLSKCQILQSDGAKQEGIHGRRFLCKACCKTFTSAWRMKQHSLAYCKNRLVMCRKCGRIFFGPDALSKHCAEHFRDVYYKCGLCGENHEKNFCNKTAKSRNVYGLPSHGISQKETDHQQQYIYAKLGKSNELIASILERSVLKTPSLSETENHEPFLEEALMGKNPSSCQIANSCIRHERAQYDELKEITIVADDPITTVETSLKEYTILNEAEREILLISDINDQSHSSEDAVPQKYLNLELPASIFHLGIRLEGCNLYNIFMGLVMDEMSSPAQDGNTHKVMNEVDNVSLRSDQEGMSMVDSELTDEKYETEMCNGKESHLHEKSDYLDISDESPEDYYLDSLETLKFLYE